MKQTNKKPTKRTAAKTRPPAKKVAAKQNTPTTDVPTILHERGKKYGAYADSAVLLSRLRETVGVHALVVGKVRMTPVQDCGLDAILGKITRIVNGDANDLGSWVDIAGYATLVVEEMKGGAV